MVGVAEGRNARLAGFRALCTMAGVRGRERGKWKGAGRPWCRAGRPSVVEDESAGSRGKDGGMPAEALATGRNHVVQRALVGCDG